MAIVSINYNKKNLKPDKRFFYNAVLITISLFLVNSILDFFSLTGLIEAFPTGIGLFLKIVIALYLKRVFDVIVMKKDLL